MREGERTKIWGKLFLKLFCFGFPLFLLFSVLYHAVTCAIVTEGLEKCKSNQKIIALAALLYAAEHDGKLPLATLWTDAVQSYLHGDVPIQCPASPQLECGYAFYLPACGRKVKTISQPDFTPLLFDSAKGRRNYADKGESLTFRHKGIAVVTFVDGHVKKFSEGHVNRLFTAQTSK